MPLLSRADAHRIVGPHFGPLFDAIHGSWTEYMTEYTDKQRAKHCATTRANILHDLQVDRAAIYFVSVQRSKILDSSGLKLFTLEAPEGQIAIRFKKMDEQLLSKNQTSKQVLSFRNQEQLDLLGAAYHLEAGYVLLRDQSGIQMVSLVCPNGTKNFWDIELTDTTADTKVRDLFDTEPAEDKVDIVRGKRIPGTEEKKSGNEVEDK